MIVKAVELERELEQRDMYSLYIWVFADERYSIIFKKRFYDLLYYDVDPWQMVLEIVNLRDDETSVMIMDCLASVAEIDDLWTPLIDLIENDGEIEEGIEEGEFGDDLIERYDLPQLLEYAKMQLNQTKLANRPEWMIEGSGSVTNIEVEKTVEEGYGLVPGHGKGFSKSIYSITQLDKKLGIDANIERENIRILGPVNQSRGVLHPKGHPCRVFGGCRMFTCNEFTPQEFEDDPRDWYSGSCEQCGMRIRGKKFAFRQPLIKGGWKGCYCSEKCVPLSEHLDLEDEKERIFQLVYITRSILLENGVYE